MGKPNPQQRRANKVTRRKQRLAGRQVSPERSRTKDHSTHLAPLASPGPTFADLGWVPPVSRLVPLDTPRSLEQLARRHRLTAKDHVCVNDQWWSPEEFAALEWIEELCDDAADQAREEILAHYGEKIPADLALLDFSARKFLGVTTWNEYGIETRAEHITALAQTPNLREALAILHRDGWVVPMADGFLDAPGLLFQQVPPAPLHVRRWPTASHLYAGFHLGRLPADEIPTLDELLYACQFQWEHQDLLPVTGRTWTPEQLSDHPWLTEGELEPDELMINEYERILQRYGEEIPADQAVMDLAVAACPSIMVGNFDLVDDARLVWDFTQSDDLRQAFGALHRDGLLIPLANGLLIAPALAKLIDEP